MYDKMLFYVANNNQLSDPEFYMMLIFHDEKIWSSQNIEYSYYKGVLFNNR